MDSDEATDNLQKFARRAFSVGSIQSSGELSEGKLVRETGSRRTNLPAALAVGVASFILFNIIFCYGAWRLERKYNAIRQHGLYTIANVDRTYITQGKGGGYNVDYHFSPTGLNTVEGSDRSGFSDNYAVALRDHKVRVAYDVYNPSNSEIDVTGWLNKPTPKINQLQLIGFIIAMSLFMSTLLGCVGGIVFGKRRSD